MNKETTDKALWEAMKNGSESAYAEIYRVHIAAMYRYGMGLSSLSEYFVFDCIHDVFTDVWAKRNLLNPPQNIRAYLLTSLKNRMQNQLLRSEKKYISLQDESFDDLWEEAVFEESQISVHPLVSKEELVKMLIEQLPPRQQEALRLRFVEELEFSELANVMNINRQSAQNLVFRAVEKLKNTLSEKKYKFLKN